MAVIVDGKPSSAEDVWLVARWAFVWLLRQSLVEAGDSPSTRLVFERAIALDGLHLHLLEPDDARDVRSIVLKVALAGAAGELPPVEVEGRVLDDKSQQQFRRAAKELIRLLSSSGEG